MQTLESVQTRHKAILRAFNQVESILAPIHTGEGKNDCINITSFNLERLAKHSDILSSEFCSVQVITEKSEIPGWHPCSRGDTFKVKIEGQDFGYSFAPELICDAKKRIEKGFKQVEAFTKKQPIYKNKPERIANNTKKTYICNSTKRKYIRHKKTKWNILILKSLNRTLIILEKYLIKSWKNFVKA